MDIIVLIFLAIKIGKLATLKGLEPGKWRRYLVFAWIAGELLGAFLGVIIFGAENQISWMLLAAGCAATSYFLIYNYLTKLPDA
jgi:hypothetical protein